MGRTYTQGEHERDDEEEETQVYTSALLHTRGVRGVCVCMCMQAGGILSSVDDHRDLRHGVRGHGGRGPGDLDVLDRRNVHVLPRQAITGLSTHFNGEVILVLDRLVFRGHVDTFGHGDRQHDDDPVDDANHEE